jgi:hypothetical protein
VIEWLEVTALFEWGGKQKARRERAQCMVVMAQDWRNTRRFVRVRGRSPSGVLAAASQRRTCANVVMEFPKPRAGGSSPSRGTTYFSCADAKSGDSMSGAGGQTGQGPALLAQNWRKITDMRSMCCFLVRLSTRLQQRIYKACGLAARRGCNMPIHLESEARTAVTQQVGHGLYIHACHDQ